MAETANRSRGSGRRVRGAFAPEARCRVPQPDIIEHAPECMDTVWLYENGTYSAFDLAQKAYLGKSLAEIADAQQQEKIERTDWKKQELQAQLDLMSDIQAIADGSERTMPDRSNISRQIQRNRSTARKQESVSLMDLLAEQQEDDFDAR